MRVVMIDDEPGKCARLRRFVHIDLICETPEQLAKFRQTSSSNPGVAVVDVGSFFKLSPENMLTTGEELADENWRVIYWSTAVGAENIRDDCWFQNRNTPESAASIAAAIKNNFQSNDLRRGEKRDQLELALAFLSAMLPFGLRWEGSQKETDRAALEEIVSTIDLKLFPDLELLFTARLKAHVLGHPLQAWPVPKQRQRDVTALDEILSGMESHSQLIQTMRESSTKGTLAGLDAAIKRLADAATLTQWNERLIELRNYLLSR